MALSADLRTLVRQLSRRLRSSSAPVADLPLPQRDALALLGLRPGMTSPELAREQRVRPQTMGATVAALRDQGLVEARPATHDARRRELLPTDAGRDLLDRVGEVRTDWLAGLLSAGLDADEQAEVARALVLLQRCLSAD